jgi:hypothetical protein
MIESMRARAPGAVGWAHGVRGVSGVGEVDTREHERLIGWLNWWVGWMVQVIDQWIHHLG